MPAYNVRGESGRYRKPEPCPSPDGFARHSWRCLAILAVGAVMVASAATAPDTKIYDGVLKRYVLENGNVRYAELRDGREDLDRFVDQIAIVSPRSNPELFATREARLAYWLNTYNALVLWAFSQDYPEKKDRLRGLIGRGLFFYQRKFTVGGERLSLATIENDIIRKQFHEPRIHFALVCASASCPDLTRDAYTGENLESLLEARTRRFLNRPENVTIDPVGRRITLSKIFDWYAEDFGADRAELLAFVARYRQDGAQLLEGKWKVDHFDYDWSPNDARTASP